MGEVKHKHKFILGAYAKNYKECECGVAKITIPKPKGNINTVKREII